MVLFGFGFALVLVKVLREIPASLMVGIVQGAVEVLRVLADDLFGGCGLLTVCLLFDLLTRKAMRQSEYLMYFSRVFMRKSVLFLILIHGKYYLVCFVTTYDKFAICNYS